MFSLDFATATPATHPKLILKFYILTRLLYATILFLLSFLPLFDTSPFVLVPASRPSWSSTLLRWDAFHFASVAQQGYQYEYQFAFQPGTPFVMRVVAEIFRAMRTRGEEEKRLGDVLVGGALASIACCSAIDLYHLTSHLTKSPHFALLTALLSLLPSSPATFFHAPYSEPFFAFLSYRGMLMCAQRKWLFASMFFAVATTFRVNGMLLGGFILWGMLIDPLIEKRRIPSISRLMLTVVLTLIPALPFLLHQYYAYTLFCQPSPTRSWCTRTIPSIYSFVQAEYWNVGFLRYWTSSQLPNFAMAAPVLVLLLYTSETHIRRVVPVLISSPSLSPSKSPQKPSNAIPPSDISTLPHAIHAFVLTLILIFASHTQIALRLASSMPYVYWSVAWLFTRTGDGRYAWLWVSWSVMWGIVSVILWTAFLPPA